ncbi:hypothetical protein [Mastigocoleus testarum]|nr:hypothetical protein [Mastigocoleus testarum]
MRRPVLLAKRGATAHNSAINARKSYAGLTQILQLIKNNDRLDRYVLIK